MKSEQINKTAAYVAIKFYGLTLIKPYRALFDADDLLFYDRLIATLPSPLNKYHTFLTYKWFRKAAMYMDEFLLPGDLMHILLRKFYIPEMIDRLLDQGFSQIVILGAGFDHIGNKYSHNGIYCVELDVPPMTHIKQRFLNQYNYSNNNLSVYPANITEHSFSDVLTEIPSLDPNAKTVAVAEGFFDYLTPGEFSKTLYNLSHFFNNEFKLISTVFSLQELSRFHAMVFRNAVKAVGEQLKLNTSLPMFEKLLKRNNFRIDQKLTPGYMRESITVPQHLKTDVLPGFYILEAAKNK